MDIKCQENDGNTLNVSHDNGEVVLNILSLDMHVEVAAYLSAKDTVKLRNALNLIIKNQSND